MGDGAAASRMKHRLRTLAMAAASAAAFVAGAAAQAVAQAPLEYEVKGAFLYKFLPFVEWPASALPAANSPFVLCTLGNDPFGPGFDKTVTVQNISGHPLAVRHIPNGGDASGCQAVFISIADPQEEAAAVHAFDGKPVLTVTDSGSASGGIISFVMEHNRVHFDIDDAAAARDGLTISSKLLDLARKVNLRKAGP